MSNKEFENNCLKNWVKSIVLIYLYCAIQYGHVCMVIRVLFKVIFVWDWAFQSLNIS